MTAAIAMADYTGPEADNLCYAIRKKKEDVLRQHEAKFKAGAKKKGIPPHIVDQVFSPPSSRSRYGFNKAHATCYGLIAYQTAYLKANYPIEFMTAVLNGFRSVPRRSPRSSPSATGWGSRCACRTCRSRTPCSPSRPMRPARPRRSASAWRRSRTSARGAVEAIVSVRDAGAEPGRSSRSTTSAGVSTSTCLHSASSSH